jgi:hypothetical protein
MNEERKRNVTNRKEKKEKGINRRGENFRREKEEKGNGGKKEEMGIKTKGKEKIKGKN